MATGNPLAVPAVVCWRRPPAGGIDGPLPPRHTAASVLSERNWAAIVRDHAAMRSGLRKSLTLSLRTVARAMNPLASSVSHPPVSWSSHCGCHIPRPCVLREIRTNTSADRRETALPRAAHMRFWKQVLRLAADHGEAGWRRLPSPDLWRAGWPLFPSRATRVACDHPGPY
jgi:hypothetical protein